MSGGLLTLTVVLLVLLAASSALFSAVETALFSLRPAELERLKKRRAGFARSLETLLENPRRLLSALLLADALVNLPLIFGGLILLTTSASLHVPMWAAALLLFTVTVFALPRRGRPDALIYNSRLSQAR